MVKKFKLSAVLVTLLALILIASGCSTSQPAKAPAGQAAGGAEKWDTVRLLYTESIYSLTSVVAVEKGFFAEEHLNVNAQPLANGGLATSALVGKSADFAVGSAGRFINAVNKNLPIRAISITHWGFSGEIVVPKSDTTSKTLEDLKGKKVALQIGSGASGVFLRYIDKHGFTPKDFKILEMDSENIPAAMEKGQLESGWTWVPFSTVMVDKGLARVMIDGDTIAKETGADYAFPLLVRQELIDKNPELVQRFVNAWVKAHVWIEKNPDQAVEILSKAWENLGMKLSIEDAKASMKYVHTDRSTISDSDVTDMVKTAEIFKKFGVADDAADAAKLKTFVNNSFAEKAVKQFRK